MYGRRPSRAIRTGLYSMRVTAHITVANITAPVAERTAFVTIMHEGFEKLAGMIYGEDILDERAELELPDDWDYTLYPTLYSPMWYVTGTEPATLIYTDKSGKEIKHVVLAYAGRMS